MLSSIKSRWYEQGGYREVMVIALPLILSTGSWSLQHFVDRMFLTWYSAEAIAASMPAGLLNWTILSLFIGTAGYANTFVAQYYGAKQYDRVGPAVWQANYLTILAVLFAIPVYMGAETIFAWADHGEKVMELEVIYFQILLFGTPFVVISNAVSGFFSGLGKTWIVMWANVAGVVVNIILDYLVIFGNYGFPEMGIAGAGWATVVAAATTSVIFLVLFMREKYNTMYNTRGWQFEKELFSRLIRFGLPNGIQFVLDLLAFSIFIMLIGRLGTIELAASNIAFNINTLAFLPMFGMSIAVSTLVGQALGDNDAQLAERSTWSAFHIAFAFFVSIGVAFFMIPDLFLWPFALEADPVTFAPIYSMTAILLQFIAFYCLFDAGVMIFSGALKGAGDTRFVAIASFAGSWGIMVVPSLIGIWFFDAGVYWLWTALAAYVAIVAFVFYWRFRDEKWKEMRVIETEEEDQEETNKKTAEPESLAKKVAPTELPGN